MLGKLLFTLSIVCLLFSCNSDIENVDVPKGPEENRVVFESSSDFMKAFEKLAYYNKNELKEWSASKKINSLLVEGEKNDLDPVELPQALQSMLNKNAEFQIKDSVIRYQNNTFYLVAVNQTALEDFVVVGDVSSNKLGNLPMTKGYCEMGTNEIDQSNQSSVKNYKCDYPLKYVNEIKAYTVRMSQFTTYNLLMMVKLEYKGKKKWHEAGEKRKVTHQLNTTIDLIPEFVGATTTPRIPTTVIVEGNLEIPLYLYSAPNSTRVKQWNVYVGGEIKQEIYGYPETNWTDKR